MKHKNCVEDYMSQQHKREIPFYYDYIQQCERRDNKSNIIKRYIYLPVEGKSKYKL